VAHAGRREVTPGARGCFVYSGLQQMTLHRVDLSGDYETTVYDAARRLLSEGANPSDMVETWRCGILSMTGVIGKLAKWRVSFHASGPCLERYATPALAGVAPKSAAQVSQGHPKPPGPVPRLPTMVGHLHSFPTCANLKKTLARKRAAACEGNRP
jgi:hypothetical protein